MNLSEQLTNLTVIEEQKRYILQANGKPLLTPAGKPYRLPTAALAEAIAKEWRAQGDKIVPATMPMTQLAATALDIVASDRERIVREVLAYSSSELLCHRAEQPETLAARQEEIWQPFLGWCDRKFGAHLLTSKGIMPIPTKPDTVAAFRKALDDLDDFVLAGLSHATGVTGSLVLGLALAKHFCDAGHAFEAAELDAGFQTLKWGVDPVTEARFKAIQQDLANCERWFGLLQ